MLNNIVSYKIWKDRYSKNENTPEENIERVAKYISNNEREYEMFKKVMIERRFFPAGRTMSNAGIEKDLTLNNCFTANFVEDNIEDIFDKVKVGALTHKRGGGIGYNFSKIRPKGQPTSNDAIASGVISFMDVFDAQTATIIQGSRRGANMGILSVRHPEILDFINAKSYDKNKLTNFNLSVLIDDEFMEAVENNSEFYLHFPVFDDKGFIIKDENKWKIKIKVKAREIWDEITKKAYDTGEPGVIFYDTLNRDNNLYYVENIVCTNPCNEYVSGIPYNTEFLHGLGLSGNSNDYWGACNLGSIFLHNHVINPFTKNAKIDYKKLKETINIAVRMLDNIIDKNKYPLKQYENYQKVFRTIGLGVTGLADMLVMLNIRYGSDESLKLIDELMDFIARNAYLTSIELAKEKGSFPALHKDLFVNSNYIQKHLQVNNKWKEVIEGIKEHGIRNARLISIAPTGTLSLVFGENCSSGIEPIFNLHYKRKIKIGGQEENNEEIYDVYDYAYITYINLKNKEVEDLIKNPPFITALELDVKEHLDVLKIIAFHTDMNVSKTINIPEDYSFEKTKDVYLYAWKNGIKGCTIFRPNSLRQGVLINDNNKNIKNENKLELKWGDRAKLPEDIIYIKRKIYTGCGKIKLFLGYSPTTKKIHDLYVVRSGMGGCEKNIQANVILMSEVLRRGGDLISIEKAFEGIGSCNSFVSARTKGQKLSVGSNCPTAILNEIKKFMKEINIKDIPNLLANEKIISNKELLTEEEKEFLLTNGEIAFVYKFNKCPVCGEKLFQQEGCFTCSSCGWTKCN